VEGEQLTTLMITHNLTSALKTGTRTIMLEAGRLILDIAGKERDDMTVTRLMELYSQKGAAPLDNDRLLLTRSQDE
jgi:putative ABC transport system ATP-binding protein